jgi:5-methylcytosine-specific restriction endonuclease McrA
MMLKYFCQKCGDLCQRESKQEDFAKCRCGKITWQQYGHTPLRLPGKAVQNIKSAYKGRYSEEWIERFLKEDLQVIPTKTWEQKQGKLARQARLARQRKKSHKAPSRSRRKKPRTSTKTRPIGGYASYKAYQRSSLWKTIRTRVLARDNHLCQLCSKAAEVVHHQSYAEAVMLGHDDSELYSLCNRCHMIVEFYPNGSKRSHAKARKEFQKMYGASRKSV